jgi:hypothetical protein
MLSHASRQLLEEKPPVYLTGSKKKIHVRMVRPHIKKINVSHALNLKGIRHELNQALRVKKINLLLKSRNNTREESIWQKSKKKLLRAFRNYSS